MKQLGRGHQLLDPEMDARLVPGGGILLDDAPLGSRSTMEKVAGRAAAAAATSFFSSRRRNARMEWRKRSLSHTIDGCLPFGNANSLKR